MTKTIPIDIFNELNDLSGEEMSTVIPTQNRKRISNIGNSFLDNIEFKKFFNSINDFRNDNDTKIISTVLDGLDVDNDKNNNELYALRRVYNTVEFIYKTIKNVTNIINNTKKFLKSIISSAFNMKNFSLRR